MTTGIGLASYIPSQTLGFLRTGSVRLPYQPKDNWIGFGEKLKYGGSITRFLGRVGSSSLLNQLNETIGNWKDIWSVQATLGLFRTGSLNPPNQLNETIGNWNDT